MASMTPCFNIDGDTVTYKAHICIVFAVDGSGPQLMPMVTRTAVVEDNLAVGCFNRCVDLAATYGGEVRQTRLWTSERPYFVYFNLSPKLPVNRTLAQLVNFNPNDTTRLFWRGDVVVMKADMNDGINNRCLDANVDDILPIQAILQDRYCSGSLEKALSADEEEWKYYCKEYCSNWLSYQSRAQIFYGGNHKQREADVLDGINELKRLLGHRILPPHPYMGSSGSISGLVTSTLLSWMPSLSLTGVVGAPKFGPDIERAIFEICAEKYPQMCLSLVVVARRVKLWVDPILYRVINLADSGERMSDYKVQRFYSNNLLKPVLPLGFYALHVKSLWIPPLWGKMEDEKVRDQILAACTGVENLVISTPTSFLESPNAGRRLRRLTTALNHPCVLASGHRSIGIKVWPFEHPCFAKLTHLHLNDHDEDWPTYRGWKNLRSLTHLGLAYASPDEVAKLWRKLPCLLYVALGHYENGVGWAGINRTPHILAAWPKRVVWLDHLTTKDWDSGARGGNDMWTLVEQEVARRLSGEAEAVHSANASAIS